MKKKTSIMVCVFFLTILAEGQNRKISLGTIARGDLNGLVLAPTIEYTKNKHTAFIGYDLVNQYGYFLTGYRFAPSDSIEKKLKLYFPVDILFKSVKIHEYNSQVDKNIHTVNTQLTLGYGFKLNFLKGFYVNSQSGLGIHYVYTNRKGTQYGTEYSGRENDFMFAWFFQIGLGYDIKL